MASGATGWGVTFTGWNGKSLAVIQDELNDGFKRILGDSAGTEDDGSIPLDSAAGQLITLIADGWADIWDAMQAIYANTDPSKATGASQDAVNSLTGARRNAASYSVATGTCTGDPNTVLVAGRIAGVTGTGALFQTLSVATLGTASSWVASNVYGTGDIVTNNSRIYRATASGIAAGSVGPSGTALSITDGGVTWRFLGAGRAYVNVAFTAMNSGQVGCLANRLATIQTPVAGWNGIDNRNDAVVGSNREKDSVFRARREALIAAAGNTTPDAIRANVLAVNQGSTDPNHDPPDSCTVFYNDTDSTDADGIPPHSVEVLVYGGTTADIAQAIWDSVGAGTRTYGNTSASAEDSEGNTHTVYFTRPTEVPIYVIAVGRYDASEWTNVTNADAIAAAAMKSALLTYTADYPPARDVRVSPLIGAMMRGPARTDENGAAVVPADPGDDPVPGILEVESIYIGTSPAPGSSAQIAITTRQIATFSSANVSITATSETP